MMGEAFWTHVTQFGMAGIIFGGFLCVLKWVFDINKGVLDGMSKEREAHQAMLRCFADNIRDVSEANKEFQSQVRAAHNAQMAEHREMVAILGRINGYKSHKE